MGRDSPPMRSLRERQRAERAALILEAAARTFTDKGYHDAAIDEIAARAGIAKGTVYLHFASKEDLLAALVERHLVDFLTEIEQASAAPLPMRARLELILRDVYTRMQERGNQMLLELSTRTGVTRKLLDERAGLQAHVARATERIAALLEEGRRADELDRAVPMAVMIATFSALVSPSGYEQLLTSGQVTPADLAAYVSRTFFPPLPPPSAQPLPCRTG